MKISVYGHKKAAQADQVRRLVSFVLEEKKVTCDELSVHFVSKKAISKLHADFFDDPTPTDCITFPCDQEYLGDIFVCPEVAKEYDPINPNLETSLYIIHGILHLLGYDDIKVGDRKKMHKEQSRLLRLIEQCHLTLS